MKNYFSYFKIMFIILGILGVLVGSVALMKYTTGGRSNFRAPEERVYDYADVLTDSEEEELRKLIADRERKIGCDIVLVTINESVLERYGFTQNTDANWEYCMETYADDFYDEHKFGYNADYEGDGVLLLDNWYEGENGSEKGSWLSTSGSVYRRFSTRMIDAVLDDVYDLVEASPYRAYRAYIEDIYRQMSNDADSLAGLMSPFILFIVALIVAAVFILTNLKTKEGTKTTVASTYVENGSIRFNVKSDTLVNKFVTSRVIQTSSGSGGGHSSGGGGGHHSSSGASHGGGGRRR